MSDRSLSSNSAGNSPAHFTRTPSEGVLVHEPAGKSKTKTAAKTWERSQSEVNLDAHGFVTVVNRSPILSQDGDHLNDLAGGRVSESSKVYWDLSRATESLEEEAGPGDEDVSGSGSLNLAAKQSSSASGRMKISLQTIHQREELKQDVSSTQMRVYQRSASETSTLSSLGSNSTIVQHVVRNSVESPGTDRADSFDSMDGYLETTSAATTTTVVTSQNISQVIAQSTAEMVRKIQVLRTGEIVEKVTVLRESLRMIVAAWKTPQFGRDYASALCDVIRKEGALQILVDNCWSTNRDLQLESSRLLEQTLTTENRDAIVKIGLESVVKMSCVVRDDRELSRVSSGILENLFKHSEQTCSRLIHLGGLESILFCCRSSDKMTLRHCAVALANLAMYGGADNQHEMMKQRAAEWLFPLAFSDDDSIRYYACLAVIVLSANKEIEVAVQRSGTLNLVQPFILSHSPGDFAHSDQSHLHGQSRGWLRRLVTVLESKREEAQSLAAFHFAMEAEIKKSQGKFELFDEIGAIDALKRVASSPNALASKFATQALTIIGEEIPYKLSQQVPLWSEEDVQYWLRMVSFTEYVGKFHDCRVDGDLLLTLNEENLRDDIGMTNGLIRKRFLKEVKKLKMTADYRSCDPTRLDQWLSDLGDEFSQYTYQMLASGVDRTLLNTITDENLGRDCEIRNGVHRMKILQALKDMRVRSPASTPPGFSDTVDGVSAVKPIDVFISYRRSNGSQLASLLKVHLQLRGFTVFLDIERLTAGKFDDSLLTSVRNAKNFVLVLTQSSLDRCVGDDNHKDWVHKEIAAAIESKCNIVPVIDNKFSYPAADTLPPDIRAVTSFNGIRWIHDYQDACIDKLERFLRGDYTNHPRSQSSPPRSLITTPSASSSSSAANQNKVPGNHNNNSSNSAGNCHSSPSAASASSGDTPHQTMIRWNSADVESPTGGALSNSTSSLGSSSSLRHTTTV